MITKDAEVALLAAFRGDGSVFFERRGFSVRVTRFDNYPIADALRRAADLLRRVGTEIEEYDETHEESFYGLESKQQWL